VSGSTSVTAALAAALSKEKQPVDQLSRQVVREVTAFTSWTPLNEALVVQVIEEGSQ
jgi:hypothetical protein